MKKLAAAGGALLAVGALLAGEEDNFTTSTTTPNIEPSPTVDRLESMENRGLIQPAGSMENYNRDAFPHWASQGGDCDTRSETLRSQAVHMHGFDAVVDNDNCTITSGTWIDFYSHSTLTTGGADAPHVEHVDAADVEVDHVVSLGDAWRSGAADWNEERREAFANDMERNLVTVVAGVNGDKSDSTPAGWTAPAADAQCAWIDRYVEVKDHYDLSIDRIENNEIRRQSEDCV